MIPHFENLRDRLETVYMKASKIDVRWTNWSALFQGLPESMIIQYVDIILAGHGVLLLQLLSYIKTGCLHAGLELAFVSECDHTPVKGADIGNWYVAAI
jgi:hypothetical protein